MNLYPHTVTVYHHDVVGDKNVYLRTVLSGVYYRKSVKYTKSGNGFENVPGTVVSCNPVLSRGYNDNWRCFPGDKLIKGVGSDIESFKELSEAVTVKSVDVNLCSSELDSVVIRCE